MTARRFGLSVAALVTMGFWGSAEAEDKAMCELVVDGQSDAVIVIDADAKGTIPLAAKQFQAYVRRMSGAHLTIEALGADDGPRLTELLSRKLVILGESAASRRLGISTADLSTDGFLTETTPAYLAIVGRDDTTRAWRGTGDPIESGTMHGVFAFLRDQGVRTFFEQDELDVIPQRTTIRVPVGKTRDAPFFPFRWGYSRRRDWGVKVGFGGTFDPWPSRHSFAGSRWNPVPCMRENDWWRLYGESHPDWFVTNRQGKRGRHLRFTVPAVKEQVIKDAQGFYAKGHDYFVLLQNDGYTSIDQSAQTQSRIRHERGYYGFLSDAIMAPFIGIARELNKSHPDRKVVLGAYHGYSRPPTDAGNLPGNAAVVLNRHRLNNIAPHRREDNHMLLDEWLALGPSEIYLWEYYCYGRAPWFGEGYELYPRFLPHAIAEDVAYLAEARRRHPTLEGEWLFFEYRSDGANAWWQFPNTYFTARLFWDPTQDIDALLNDFYATAFGPAAGEMEAFYSLCESTWTAGAPEAVSAKPAPRQESGVVLTNRAMGHHFLDIFLDRADFDRIWTPEVRARLTAHLARAAELAAGTDAAKRVAFVNDGFSVFVNGGYRFRSDSLAMVVDGGHVIALSNPVTAKQVHQVDPGRSRIPLLKIMVKGKHERPRRMGWDPKTRTAQLVFQGVTADVRITERSDCLVLELTALRDRGGIVDAVVWGPYRTTLSPEGGDIVTDGGYAVGLVSLAHSAPGLPPEPGKEAAPWMRKAAQGGKGKGYLTACATGAKVGSRIALTGGTPDQVREASRELP